MSIPLLRYVGESSANTDYAHGQLQPVVGASHFQVLRANRYRFELADGFGWTYNHAPMLAYWRGRFYLQYLSNPAAEHAPPGQTLLSHSADGFAWERPEAIFPICPVPEGVYRNPALVRGAYAVMHQRMGFYTAPDGRLLTLGFYGICAHTASGSSAPTAAPPLWPPTHPPMTKYGIRSTGLQETAARKRSVLVIASMFPPDLYRVMRLLSVSTSSNQRSKSRDSRCASCGYLAARSWRSSGSSSRGSPPRCRTPPRRGGR